MKLEMRLVLIFSMMIWGALGMAATEAAPVAAKSSTPNSKVQKEMNFEDLLVQGKYHFSDEAVTTVEEDKVLDGLIGVPKDFKDRIKQTATRQ